MKVGIAGANTKGTELVKILSQAGFKVLLVDPKREALEEATAALRKSWEVGETEGKKVETSVLMERVQITQDKQALAKNDWILSTLNDSETIELLRELEPQLSKETLFASTSATLAVTRLSKEVKRGDRIVGLHFIDAAQTKFAEIIRGVLTSSETMGKAAELLRTLGFAFVTAHDFPGFVVYRVLAPLINEAVYSLYEGMAPAEEIDRAMVAVTGQTMGPLAMADAIGLDTVLSVLQEMQNSFGNPKFAPCPLLSKYVEAGYCGKKSGKGFYEYSAAPKLSVVGNA